MSKFEVGQYWRDPGGEVAKIEFISKDGTIRLEGDCRWYLPFELQLRSRVYVTDTDPAELQAQLDAALKDDGDRLVELAEMQAQINDLLEEVKCLRLANDLDQSKSQLDAANAQIAALKQEIEEYKKDLQGDAEEIERLYNDRHSYSTPSIIGSERKPEDNRAFRDLLDRVLSPCADAYNGNLYSWGSDIREAVRKALSRKEITNEQARTLTSRIELEESR